MKNTKKVLSIILAILMIATSVPFAFAADTATLTVGSEFEADLTKQGVNYDETNRYIFKVLTLPEGSNYGTVELVSPAEGVYPTAFIPVNQNPQYGDMKFSIVSIAKNAFFNNGKNLETVQLGFSQVSNIGDNAFINCNKLTYLGLLTNTDELVIGTGAFSGCTNLAGESGSLNLNNNVTGQLGITFFDCDGIERVVCYGEDIVLSGTFYGCDKLQSVYFSSVADFQTNYDMGTFGYCPALESVTLNGTYTQVPNIAFENCSSLKSFSMSDSVTDIGLNAFYGTNLTEISLGKGVTTVANGAFYVETLKRVVFTSSQVPTYETESAYSELYKKTFERSFHENLHELCVDYGYGDGMYAEGEVVEITADAPAEGYEFDKWVILGDLTVADAAQSTTTVTTGSEDYNYIYATYKKILTECDKGNHTSPEGTEACEDYICTACSTEVEATAKHTVPEVWNCTVGYDCTVCGATVDAVEAHTVPEGTATCEDYTCTVCGTAVEATGNHNHVAQEETRVSATCTEEGSVEMKCECGASYIETLPIDKNNHTGEADVIKNKIEASCGADGYTGDIYWSCCDALYAKGKVDLRTGDHNYETQESTRVPATCTKEGSVEMKCECDDSYTETLEIDKSNHTGEADVIKNKIEASCGVNGYTGDIYWSCCDTLYKASDVDPATGEHNHVAQEETRVPATCTKEGSVEMKCECDDSYTETLEIDKNNHTGGTEVKNAKDATATTDGYTGDTHCKGCGAKLADGEVISATGTTTPDEPDTPDTPNDPSGDCDHLCHKSGFMGFIWKIVQFFWKLFRMNPVCECGVAHY